MHIRLRNSANTEITVQKLIDSAFRLLLTAKADFTVGRFVTLYDRRVILD